MNSPTPNSEALSMAKGNPKTSKKKTKRSFKKSGPDAVAMKHKTSQPNPFETIWSNRKFDILGKKRKGEERRIGLARSCAIEKVIIFQQVLLLISSSVCVHVFYAYFDVIVFLEGRGRRRC